ncbi:uncharacterized protein APUU_60326A [Aspergillus puulaauensis]|uniref:Myb-like domain-containing protein n=1 Tax=Aspergillus puulaauensis TaxID=1220207 RepID=A0A7R8ARW7_9EURO|nr:uncharacterized protein APUU_60326A [Aspergillus puulaauensis]BCS27278.1 hypothetical protein APUU_60326A [Aspergillus puulaauensis]
MAPETGLKKPQLAWSPEERARLIQLREKNPDITWTEFHKRYPFPNRTPTSVFQCYRRYNAPEDVGIRRKRRRRRANGDGSRRTTKRGRYENQDWDDENMDDEDDEGDESDEDEVDDTNETEDQEWTDEEAGDIDFNGAVSPRGSPCTRDDIRRMSNPKRTAPKPKLPVPYTARKPSTGTAINPRFVAAQTIHCVDPTHGINLIDQPTSCQENGNPTSTPNVRASLRFVHAAWTEVMTHLEGSERFGSRLDSIEADAVKAREEVRQTKEDMKKMQEDIRKIKEDASKDNKTLTGMMSLLGNLRMVDLFRMTGGGGEDLKIEPPSDSGDPSTALLTRTPECDSESEHLRAWSG